MGRLLMRRPILLGGIHVLVPTIAILLLCMLYNTTPRDGREINRNFFVQLASSSLYTITGILNLYVVRVSGSLPRTRFTEVRTFIFHQAFAEHRRSAIPVYGVHKHHHVLELGILRAWTSADESGARPSIPPIRRFVPIHVCVAPVVPQSMCTKS